MGPCRSHLFRALRIKPVNIAPLLEILKNYNNTVSSVARQLEFKFVPYIGHQLEPPALISLLQLLPRIDSFVFIDMSSTNVDNILAFDISGIQDITLTTITFKHPRALTDLIKRFPALKTISLEDADFEDHSVPSGPFSLASDNVTFNLLDLHQQNTDILIPWIYSLDQVPTIRRIAWFSPLPVMDDLWSAFQEFLPLGGSNVETIEFCMTTERGTPGKFQLMALMLAVDIRASAPFADLSALTRLESIEFSEFELTQWESQAVSRILRSICSDQLHTAKFALYQKVENSWKAEIDILMDTLRGISSLRRVCFEMHFFEGSMDSHTSEEGIDSEEMRRYVKSKLPNVSEMVWLT